MSTSMTRRIKTFEDAGPYESVRSLYNIHSLLLILHRYYYCYRVPSNL